MAGVGPRGGVGGWPEPERDRLPVNVMVPALVRPRQRRSSAAPAAADGEGQGRRARRGRSPTTSPRASRRCGRAGPGGRLRGRRQRRLGRGDGRGRGSARSTARAAGWSTPSSRRDRGDLAAGAASGRTCRSPPTSRCRLGGGPAPCAATRGAADIAVLKVAPLGRRPRGACAIAERIGLPVVVLLGAGDLGRDRGRGRPRRRAARAAVRLRPGHGRAAVRRRRRRAAAPGQRRAAGTEDGSPYRTRRCWRRCWPTPATPGAGAGDLGRDRPRTTSR